MGNLRDRITKILEHWFIQEPLLFQVICIHEIVENRSMACPMRCGKRILEYNPDFLADVQDSCLDEMFRTEAIRLLLKHPYERKPEGCCGQAVAIGSNLVVGDNYSFHAFNIEKPKDFELDRGMPYEWYSRKIQSMLPQGDGTSQDSDSSSSAGDNADKYRDMSQLWEEDDMSVMLINGIIESCTSWGSICGQFAEMLKASTRAKIDWRKIFSGFRACILSEKRKLTRMRPNRRTGFDQMGSTRKFTTKLLVAVDVSGSIDSVCLSNFYGVVNSAFRYGFECVDTVQFDCGIRKVENITKATREVIAIGRGGTSFQEPIDYAHQNGYDGLVILTDGYAPIPNIPDNMSCKIIWVCNSEKSYEQHNGWMSKSGRVCVMQLA